MDPSTPPPYSKHNSDNFGNDRPIRPMPQGPPPQRSDKSPGYSNPYLKGDFNSNQKAPPKK